MKVEVRAQRPEKAKTALLALYWFQAPGTEGDGPQVRSREAEAAEPDLADLDAGVGGTLTRALENRDFRGDRGETLLLYRQRGDGPERVLLVGAGTRADVTAERLREASGRAAAAARELRLDELSLWLSASRLSNEVTAEWAARALAEGAVLSGWRFDEFRSDPLPEDSAGPGKATLIVPEGELEPACEGAELGRVLASAQNYARELAARPANVLNPRYLANEAERLGAEYGFETKVLDPVALNEEGMTALLAVAAGSEEEPRFIAMLYEGDSGERPPLVLVGKGVTFDAGGLSLKTPQGMESMKYDMAGAGAVLGAMRAIAELALPVSVVGLIPAVENLPSGHALRPGDVIRSHSGKMIEVLNTDAEGRLILADALSFASRYDPQAVVDIATLTGACVVALGHHAMGLMGNDEGLIDDVRRAADLSGERAWPLPLWDDYRQQLKSTIADMKNTGGRPAGTITAGMFLREFAGTAPWAHLDIAGTAWAGEAGPYQPQGPTGVGVRLLTEWVRGRAG